jgi:anti-sigma regulatory factor (Ser/Thr protein kinase)
VRRAERLVAEDTARARRILEEVLEQESETVLRTAQLLTTELVTNAFQHGSDEATVSVTLDDQLLRVEIEDYGSMIGLAPLYVVAHSERGRGLAVVDALATTWGVERRPIGKAVWFELALDPTGSGGVTRT